MTSTQLFRGAPLARVLDSQTNRLLTAAANLKPTAWEHRPDGPVRDPAAELAGTVTFTVPVLDWEAMSTNVVEAPIRNSEKGRSSVATVAGMRAVVSIPYTGSTALLQARPTRHFLGGITDDVRVQLGGLRGGVITITVTGRHIETAALNAAVTRSHRAIDLHLGWVSTEVQAWRRSLEAGLIYEVAARFSFLSEFGVLLKVSPVL